MLIATNNLKSIIFLTFLEQVISSKANKKGLQVCLKLNNKMFTNNTQNDF